MQVGIVGYTSVGKTTLFNTLTGLEADTGYGGKRKVNTGTIDVPDPRIDRLAEICNPKRIIYAKITFSDIPGQAPGTGDGIDPQMLQSMRNLDALALVVRGFESPLFLEDPDPLGDIRAFQDELKLADQIIIEKRLERLKKEKGHEREEEVLQKCLDHIEEDHPLRTLDLLETELQIISGYRFLSLKHLLIVLNIGEDELTSDTTQQWTQAISDQGLEVFPISAALEEEIATLDEEEQEAFLSDLGLEETAKARFIRAAYRTLNLISFLTQGPDEARAWTIRRDTPARRAARAIHSDLERGFIRAEVISYEDFIQYGSEAACRAEGKARLEGKDYIVQDGDVVHIRANV